DRMDALKESRANTFGTERSAGSAGGGGGGAGEATTAASGGAGADAGAGSHGKIQDLKSEAGVLRHDASAKESAKVQRWKHHVLGRDRGGGENPQEAEDR
ncbi:hypothetical protein LTS18_007898, partial [Coniosporium uncinatum]